MTESGIFQCKKCGHQPFYDLYKWQKKDNKWIFYAKHPEKTNMKRDWIGKWNWDTEYYLERAVYDWPYDDSDYELIYIWKDHFQTPEECWEKIGGQTEEQWNEYYKNNYECQNCKLKATSFKDFI